ncbi:hypothetical protein MKW92_026994 [Papaver armeniacum]|nr:hypothetical protein MKW92_026994 [Papaver armeniacum]
MAWNTPNVECRMYEARYPEVGMAVMTQVKEMTDMGAYVSLVEYNNMEGLVLFDELSKTCVRSVKKLLKAGRPQPLMVLRVDEEKGYVDLSKTEDAKKDLATCEERYKKSKRVHSVMRHVAQAKQFDLEDLYLSVGWPLYRKYMHAYEAFKLILTDPDTILDSLTREVTEVGPDGQEVTKVLPALTEELKYALLMNIERHVAPQTKKKLRAEIEVTCFEFDGVLHIKEAMRKAEATGNDVCPVKVKLVVASRYVLTTGPLTRLEQGKKVLDDAIQACTEIINSHNGKLEVKAQKSSTDKPFPPEYFFWRILSSSEKRRKKKNGRREGDRVLMLTCALLTR